MHYAALVEVRSSFYRPPPCNKGNEPQDGPYIYIEEYNAVGNDVMDEKHKLHQYQQYQYEPSHGTPPIRSRYAVNSTMMYAAARMIVNAWIMNRRSPSP